MDQQVRSGDLNATVRRLLRLRFVLFVALVFCGIFVIGVPFTRSAPDDAGVKSPNVAAPNKSPQNKHQDSTSANSTKRPEKTAGQSGTTTDRGQAATVASLPDTISQNANANDTIDGSPATGTDTFTNNGAATSSGDTQPAVKIDEEKLRHMNELLTEWTRRSHEVSTRVAHAITEQVNHLPTEPPIEDAAKSSLVLHNPSYNGGAVHFVVDGEVVSLQPSEYRDLGVQGPRRIEFHRGGEFGFTELTLADGEYAFHVTRNGWDLLKSSTPESGDAVEATTNDE